MLEYFAIIHRWYLNLWMYDQREWQLCLQMLEIHDASLFLNNLFACSLWRSQGMFLPAPP